MNYNCPICSAGTYSKTDRKGRVFHFCSVCQFISLDPSFHLSFEEERSRYDQHNNNPDDKGYRQWLEKFILQAVKPFVPAGSRILDFGSGPEPVLARLLQIEGYSVEIYDKHFSEKPYSGLFDMITATEVFEHIAAPLSVVKHLKNSLKPKGFLSVKTAFRPENDDKFLKWWYKEDATHISFFSDKSLESVSSETGLELFYSDCNSVVIFRN